jgi:hypothetical protein
MTKLTQLSKDHLKSPFKGIKQNIPNIKLDNIKITFTDDK